MRLPRLIAVAAILTVTAALHVTRPDAAQPAVVPLETIRYDDLTDRVVALQGRVVVVDFWADYCLPCKREFPHLVELHQKYSNRGLTALSVSLDDPHDDEARDRVRKFLAAREATFVNFLLDEKPDVWQAKLKIDGPPCVFVFDRRGRLVKRYHDHVDYAEIERLVADLLK
jgi:thiol-disulfide isomerase/thioredoxin